MGRQQGVEDRPATAANIVAVRVGALPDQAVGAQQAQLAAEGGGTSALLRVGFGRGGVKQGLQTSNGQKYPCNSEPVDVRLEQHSFTITSSAMGNTVTGKEPIQHSGALKASLREFRGGLAILHETYAWPAV